MREPKRGKQLINEITDFQVPANGVVVWHLNQFGYAYKHNNVVVYIDPYLSDDLVNATRGKADQHSKMYEPLVSGKDIDNANYVICTHDHLDHLDPTAVREISEASPQAKFIVTKQSRSTMEKLGISSEQIVYMDANETKDFGDLKLHTFKGAHENFDYDEELGYAYLGFHITLGETYIYHSGDTVLFDELVEDVKEYPVDLAFLPINGREYQKYRSGIMGNMNLKEAAQFGVEIDADIIFPGHWGMHYENTERPGSFVDYITESYRFQKFRVMVPGDREIYIK